MLFPLLRRGQMFRARRKQAGCPFKTVSQAPSSIANLQTIAAYL
jgi:hypothetical protein